MLNNGKPDTPVHEVGAGGGQQQMAADTVIAFVGKLIEDGQCRPGDKLPPERELATKTGVSRPSVRAGLRALAAMGIVESRHGSGTFIADGPRLLHSAPLQLLAALHGISDDQIFEIRQVLEVDVAELAAQRATGEQLAAISEELVEMYAHLDEPQLFFIHDIRFHRAIAHAAGNPMLSAMVDLVSEVFSDQRTTTAYESPGVRQAAEHHKKIYQAIRDHDPKRARMEMKAHLVWALEEQISEQERQKDPNRVEGS